MSPYRLAELIESGVIKHRREGDTIKLRLPESTARSLNVVEIAEAKRLLKCEFCADDPAAIIGPRDARPLPLCAGHFAQVDCAEDAYAWPPIRHDAMEAVAS